MAETLPELAAARAAHPDAALLLVRDLRPGAPADGQVLVVEPTSAWFALLPREQVVEITAWDGWPATLIEPLREAQNASAHGEEAPARA